MAAAAPAAGPRVVVIGAGISGLTAARDLRRKGAEVLVVEARQRLGGRTFTERFSDGTAVDLGAAWLHGHSRGNPLTALAQECGATLVETDWDRRIFCFPALGPAAGPPDAARKHLVDGDWEEAEEAFGRAKSLYEQEQARRQKSWPSVPDEGIWPAAAALTSKKFAGVASLPERLRCIVRFLWAEETEHDYAAPLEDLSFTWWNADSEFDGPDCLWRDGIVQLVEHLAADTDVRLGCPVVAVRGEGGGAVVELASGECLSCDAVVCTLPLGVLQAGRVRFEPPLPEDKVAAVGRLGMALLDKVALRFDRAFWASLPPSSSKEALGKLRGAGGELHALVRVPVCEARLQDSAMEAPFIVNLQPATGAPVLVAYYVAGHARAAEQLTDEAWVEHTMATLRAMFSEEAMAGVQLLEHRVARWAADELSLGSYSYLPTGATPQDRELLARPEGLILFAGEAAEPRYPSTVHGAYLSGARAAKEAAIKIGLAKPKGKASS